MKQEIEERVAAYITSHPEQTYREMAVLFGCSQLTLQLVAKKYGIRRIKPITVELLNKLEAEEAEEAEETQTDVSE